MLAGWLYPNKRRSTNSYTNGWTKILFSNHIPSPVVLVKKKDGTTRVCVDYRKLNEKIIKMRYPLPIIEDQIDRLQGAKIFSTIDIKNGFFHVRVADDSRKYTAFIVPNGHYEFLRMPFRLSTSPAYFQKYVNAVFADLVAKNIVSIYMDDLIIPSKDSRRAIIFERSIANSEFVRFRDKLEEVSALKKQS